MENRFYTLYEVMDSTDTSLGVFINGQHMSAEEEVFYLSKTYDLWLINLTIDPHPMHMHLVNFQFYKRRPFNVDSYKNNWLNSNTGEPPYNYSNVKILDPSDYFTDSPWQ